VTAIYGTQPGDWFKVVLGPAMCTKEEAGKDFWNPGYRKPD